MTMMFEVWNGNPLGMVDTVTTIAEVERVLQLGSANDDFTIWLIDMGGYLELDGENADEVDYPAEAPTITSLQKWRDWLDSPYGRKIALRDRMWAENAERQASLVRGRDNPNGQGV